MIKKFLPFIRRKASRRMDKTRKLKIRQRHLQNELEMLRQEYEEARSNYFTIYSHMERIVDERTEELRELQTKLEQKGRELQKMIDASPQLIYYTDRNRRFLRVNRQFSRLMDRPIETIPGKKPRELFSRRTADFFTQGWKTIQRGEEVSGQTGYLETREGKKPVLANKFPNRNNRGEVIGIIGFIQDLSEIEAARREKQILQERVYRAEKMEAIGLLAGGVAHDSNNIIGGIIGYLELVLMDLEEDNPHKGYLEEALSSAQEMSNLVQELLNMSRQGMEEKIVIDLNQTIQNFLTSTVIMDINERFPRLAIETSLEKDLRNIYGTPAGFNKILINLTLNAAEATEKGTVTLSTRNVEIDTPRTAYDLAVSPGLYTQLSVEDTGRGIGEEDINRIFEPFYTKKKMGRSGTGLGLAVVYGTVKDLGGFIDVSSREGKGTRFDLFFPSTGMATDAPDKDLELRNIYGSHENILIVDDEKSQREIASAILKKLRYRPREAASGEDALEEVKKRAYDLVILDMIMEPGLDGLETYRKILQINPNQRALIITGFSQTGRMDQCLRLGKTDYLKKPLALEKLGRAVYELLHAPGP